MANENYFGKKLRVRIFKSDMSEGAPYNLNTFLEANEGRIVDIKICDHGSSYVKFIVVYETE